MGFLGIYATLFTGYILDDDNNTNETESFMFLNDITVAYYNNKIYVGKFQMLNFDKDDELDDNEICQSNISTTATALTSEEFQKINKLIDEQKFERTKIKTYNTSILVSPYCH